MKTRRFELCRGGVLAASLLALTCVGVSIPMVRAHAGRAQGDAGQAILAQASTVPGRVTQVVDEADRATLQGNVHRMARSEFDRGAVADSQTANHMVLLLQRSADQQAALRQLLDEQQDKGSKNYHAWLTPEQFGKQFGPADSDLQAVTDWLTSRGFSDIKVNPGRTRVEFSGNVGQVRNAFQTEIHHFLVNGTMHMAAVSEAQIPAALAPVVSGVVSLHDFRPRAHAHRLGTFRRTKATGEVKPLFSFTGCGSGGASPCNVVGPGDFAKIYNVPSNLDGAGVTIAIVQDSNLNVADVQAYRKLFNLPNNFDSTHIVLNGPDPGIQGPTTVTGDEIEADLDVQLAGGVAPGANIQLVVSENPQSIGATGTDLSAIYIIDNNIAPIMSESFGACEPQLTASNERFYNDLWQQAAAQGITVILSSGDSGSDSCDQGKDFSTSGLSVSGLASTQYNVAIGGTDFSYTTANPATQFWNAPSGATTSAKGYVPEATWNDSCAATAVVGTLTPCTAAIISRDTGTGFDLTAGGGGPSALNAKPTWQTGITGADGFRDLPDISFFAGNGANASFYVICEMDANTGTGSSTSSCDLNSPFNDFQGVGGTSAGAPAFAGIMALVIQKNSLQRQGNANFVLYQLYKKGNSTTICPSSATPASMCIFYDTPSGSNISVACQGGTPNCSNTSTAASQFGVLVDPAHTTTPAWTTATWNSSTSGYDLATGLGSVNVTNLINNWTSATFAADTVAITSTNPAAINITHGQSATFNVKVTQGSGTTVPTGSVSLVAQSTGKQAGLGASSLSTPITLDSTGAVAITTNQLPGGTSYPVVASYGGDGTFAAGTSAPVTVTVAPEASKTVVSLVTLGTNNTPTVGGTTAAYGSGYILQIAVQDSAGNQCVTKIVACPTGTVTLTDNGQPLNDFSAGNSAKLNSQGIAEDQPVQLPAGSHSLVATYSGDNSFSGSASSPPTAITITKATPSGITVTPSAASVAAGQNVTLTATIATQSSGAGPTGTVTFMSGATTLGTAPVTGTAASGLSGRNPVAASGTAALPTKFATAGAQSITATYSGDSNYNTVGPSPAATVTVTGSQATTTVVTSSANSIASGTSVTLTAKVTSSANNGPAITGTVQFMNGTSALGSAATCTGAAGSGTCTAMLSTSQLTGAGTKTITAVYSGDTNYAGSTSSAIMITVTAVTTTTTALTSSATSVASGGSVTLTATVTSSANNGPAITGTVQFMNGTTALGTAATCTGTAGTASAPATCTATLTTALSMVAPPVGAPRGTPNFPAGPLFVVAAILLIALLAGRSAPRRLGYACVGLLLVACVAAGFAGCGGGNSSRTPTPTSHNDSITAVYGGDPNYSGSTSAAVSISIH
jgi:hypothetical protein